MTSSLETDRSEIDALARQTGFTADAVAAMMRSVVAGNGRMAQFDHPEFGGAGQWMQGGMLMIGDFSDRDLQRRIARLCDAIAERLASDPVPPTTGSFQRQSQAGGGAATVQDSRDSHAGWPASWGSPATSGAQNDMRYAWFPDARRLAIDVGGTITCYDTGDHRIAGVSQQQGHDRTLAFTSQHGRVELSSLPIADAAPDASNAEAGATQRETPPVSDAPNHSQGDPFQTLEKLAALHARGILADEEFAAKKAELLARL